MKSTRKEALTYRGDPALISCPNNQRTLDTMRSYQVTTMDVLAAAGLNFFLKVFSTQL